jgi:hypothetical protein
MVLEHVTLQDGTELPGIPRDFEIFRTATALLQKVFFGFSLNSPLQRGPVLRCIPSYVASHVAL